MTLRQRLAGVLGLKIELIDGKNASTVLLSRELDRACDANGLDAQTLLPDDVRGKLSALAEKIKSFLRVGSAVKVSDIRQILEQSGLTYKLSPAGGKKGFYATVYVDKTQPGIQFRMVYGHLEAGERPDNHRHITPAGKPNLPGEVTVLIAGGPFQYRDPATGTIKQLILEGSPESRLRVEPGDTMDIYPPAQEYDSHFLYFSFADDPAGVTDREYVEWMLARNLQNDIDPDRASEVLIELGDKEELNDADKELMIQLITVVGIEAVSELLDVDKLDAPLRERIAAIGTSAGS